MNPFNRGSAYHRVICWWLKKEWHHSIPQPGTQASDTLFLMLFLLSLIACKAICKLHTRKHCQNLVSWFMCRDGQPISTPIEKRIGAVTRLNPIHVGCALVHRFFAGILLKTLSRFPFQPETVNEWFTVPRQDAHVGEEESRDLNVINVNGTNSSEVYKVQNNAAFPVSLSEENRQVFFHGTSHEYAQDIINEGIRLERSRERLDFSSGDGFYLNDKLHEALDWAQGKSNPAVLIYRFSKTTMDEFVKLDCTITNEQTKKNWQNVVREFRSGNPDRRFLRKNVGKVDYIEGPIAREPKDRYEERFPHPKSPDSYQLCVRSHKMAEKFNQSLHSVLFLSK